MQLSYWVARRLPRKPSSHAIPSTRFARLYCIRIRGQVLVSPYIRDKSYQSPT
jgi:hypothetical protein